MRTPHLWPYHTPCSPSSPQHQRAKGPPPSETPLQTYNRLRAELDILTEQLSKVDVAGGVAPGGVGAVRRQASGSTTGEAGAGAVWPRLQSGTLELANRLAELEHSPYLAARLAGQFQACGLLS
jgi:hypothetical protein